MRECRTLVRALLSRMLAGNDQRSEFNTGNGLLRAQAHVPLASIVAATVSSKNGFRSPHMSNGRESRAQRL